MNHLLMYILQMQIFGSTIDKCVYFEQLDSVVTFKPLAWNST